MTNELNMQNLPALIELAVVRQAETAEQVRSLAVQMAQREAELTLEIHAALNDAGKPKYGNEKLRDAALLLALRDDEPYQELGVRLLVAADDKVKAAARLEKLRGVQKTLFLDKRETITEKEMKAA